MPLPYAVALVGTVLLALVLRMAVPRSPVPRLARPLPRVDAVVAGLGVLGLVFHCTAMFYRRVVEAIPGTSAAVDLVNRMGPASVVMYVVPAVLVLVGLRRQHPAVLGLLTLALVAVGVTMYNGSPLPTHLATIVATAVVLAIIGGLLTRGVDPRPRTRVAAELS